MVFIQTPFSLFNLFYGIRINIIHFLSYICLIVNVYETELFLMWRTISSVYKSMSYEMRITVHYFNERLDIYVL